MEDIIFMCYFCFEEIKEFNCGLKFVKVQLFCRDVIGNKIFKCNLIIVVLWRKNNILVF